MEPTVDHTAAEREPDNVTPTFTHAPRCDFSLMRVPTADAKCSCPQGQPDHVTPDVRHFAALADAYTTCGLERATVRWTDDPATPVDCAECAGKLIDKQLAEPERRTVSLEVLTDELRFVYSAEPIPAEARVAVVLRESGQPLLIADTEAPWTSGTPGEPVKALRGLLTEMIAGKNRLERNDGRKVELLMPTPDVLAALDGRPDAQLLTAPVWVLAMDVTPGMLLAPESAAPQRLVTDTPKCTDPECAYGSCAVFVVAELPDGELHQSGYARTRVRIPVSVTR